METTPVSEDCCVKVAVHVRPLIVDEKLQGCNDCVTVTPGKPQVQIGTHSFTFDHVYGSTMGSPASSMFDECIVPLVNGLFQGYNATVLAYGQTGSGKTYTMGTGFKDSCHIGITPQVMNALFNKIDSLKHQIQFQLHVSFIEILKEEVHDLLDPTSPNKSDTASTGKVHVPGKPPIQIRESSNGVITLAGSTEVSVTTLKEMAACLEQGSLSRATGSTNMNNQSSRSHAIFIITLQQMPITGDGSTNDVMNEEYLCAKLHLVDLAGSERAKRTGSDGMRFKEGVHINKGLLALGNVISALGDEKKRKEGIHVPYRDSKLTRLLQDSLGGNNRTVMIACISPADINAEETLNTLKYANRARNIQNKPVVNRDPMSNEMLKMRQQLQYLQAELCARGGSDEVQVLKERIAWLEATNEDLCQKLHEYRKKCNITEQCEIDSRNFDEEAAKEWEHKLLQNTMDKESHELNRRLEEKESKMKLFGGDTVALKQHFGKKIQELEDEKRAVQQERDRLLAEIENLSAGSEGQKQRVQDIHAQKLKSLEAQILDFKRKQENQVQVLKLKHKSDEATKQLQDEIQFIKAQKVQLQHRIKQEADQFRQWKASREKELLQTNDKALQQWLEHELEVVVNVHEVRSEYESQSQVRAAMAEELAVLKNRFARASSMTLNARMTRIASLENMLNISSDSLIAMASQLSEAEERERSLTNRGRWNQLRSMGDAKNLLQYMFNSLGDARCQLWEKDMEIKEMKEQLKELVSQLRQSELQREDVENELKLREQAVAIALATSLNSLKHIADDMNGSLSPMSVPVQKQLKYSPGIVNVPVRELVSFIDQTRKMVPLSQLPMKKLVAIGRPGNGKLWRWKRWHNKWHVQYKWKWQKPWRLSEWIRHSDENIIKAKPRSRSFLY
ncbi:hypothetical protein ERO13_D06G019027v2 [Gossypium hirsutum]|nr:hypothetical protein ERO13_D06G019027v2 [Gossypium hirsutum]KAG4140449.1 hypothetical protein ERO13_D06G019027v2 [Gossypium hirsutum]